MIPPRAFVVHRFYAASGALPHLGIGVSQRKQGIGLVTAAQSVDSLSCAREAVSSPWWSPG